MTKINVSTKGRHRERWGTMWWNLECQDVSIGFVTTNRERHLGRMNCSIVFFVDRLLGWKLFWLLVRLVMISFNQLRFDRKAASVAPLRVLRLYQKGLHSTLLEWRCGNLKRGNHYKKEKNRKKVKKNRDWNLCGLIEPKALDCLR